MKKLSGKGRRILRAIYRGLGVTAVTLVFHSCDGLSGNESSGNESSGVEAYDIPAPAYGMPPDYREELIIRGSIISKETGEPIPGIHVRIDGYNWSFAVDIGRFYIYVPKQDNYQIIFTDVDLYKNGGLFKPYTITLTQEEVENLNSSPLRIELEKAE